MRGTVIEVPYPTRSDAESAQPPVKKQEEAEAAAIYLEAEDEKAKEAARKVILSHCCSFHGCSTCALFPCLCNVVMCRFADRPCQCRYRG